MRTLCGTIIAAAVYCGAFAALGDSLGNIGDVRLKGRLGERLDAMIARHVADRDVDYITAPFMEKTETKGWWHTEFWGKWMHAAVPYAKYLDFAAYIVEGMTKPEKGPRLIDLALKGVSVADRNEPDIKGGDEWAYVCKHGKSKAYEMMSCYHGLLEYCEIVKLCKYENTQCPMSAVDDILKAAIMTAEDIVKEEVNLAGGCASSEAWFHGAKKQHLPYVHLQETCVTTTWMRFCEKLLEVTDDPKWADQIERTFYNAYLGALRSDGGEFAAYTPLTGNRWHGMNHCFMHTDCCTANGPQRRLRRCATVTG